MTSDKRMSGERAQALNDLREERDRLRRELNAALESRDNCVSEIDALRAELTAARTVEDGEVAETIRLLRDGSCSGEALAEQFARLSAAKAEAERLLSHRTKDMQRWIDHHNARADTAERERDEARAALAQARAVLEEIKPHMREDAVWSRIGKALFTLAIAEGAHDK